jgi:hypothetical protein
MRMRMAGRKELSGRLNGRVHGLNGDLRGRQIPPHDHVKMVT